MMDQYFCLSVGGAGGKHGLWSGVFEGGDGIGKDGVDFLHAIMNVFPVLRTRVAGGKFCSFAV